MSLGQLTSEQPQAAPIPHPETVDQVLLRVMSAIETATTLDELLLLALNEIGRTVNGQPTMMALLADDGTHIEMINSFPPRIVPIRAIALRDAPYFEQVVQTRMPLQLTNLDPVALHPEMAKVFRDGEIQTLLLMPLIAQDRVISLLGLAGAGAPRSFSEDELQLLRILMVPLASALAAFLTTEPPAAAAVS